MALILNILPACPFLSWGNMAWVQFFAAFGFGTIVAALLSRAVAISNHRQKWIDALRDDLVMFLKEVDVLHFRVPKMLRDGLPEDMEKQQDARNSAMMAHRRVLMRLNMTEELHVNLANGLKALMTIDTTVADEGKVDAVVNASREVLKYEWAVAKYGVFIRFMAPEQWRKKKRVTDVASVRAAVLKEVPGSHGALTSARTQANAAQEQATARSREQ